MISQLSMKVREEALALALNAHTWTKGRSKRTGEPFWIIPSRSAPNTGHYTTARGCTCRGFLNHGDCAHAEAVRMHEGHQEATRLVKMYADIVPTCRVKGCQDDPEPRSLDCYRHQLVDAF